MGYGSTRFNVESPTVRLHCPMLALVRSAPVKFASP
jgi:hypothetical protein